MCTEIPIFSITAVSLWGPSGGAAPGHVGGDPHSLASGSAHKQTVQSVTVSCCERSPFEPLLPCRYNLKYQLTGVSAVVLLRHEALRAG